MFFGLFLFIYFFGGSKFIKQAGSDSEDSCPKAEHQGQRRLSSYSI
jgi:hypothetical protein